MSHPVLKTRRYQQARLVVLARDPDCQLRRRGCTGTSGEADHHPPLAILLDHLGDTPEFRDAACDPNNMRGACPHCNRGAGGALGGARRRARTTRRPTPTTQRSRNW